MTRDLRVLGWLPGYRRDGLSGDTLGAITAWAKLAERLAADRRLHTLAAAVPGSPPRRDSSPHTC